MLSGVFLNQTRLAITVLLDSEHVWFILKNRQQHHRPLLFEALGKIILSFSVFLM